MTCQDNAKCNCDACIIERLRAELAWMTEHRDERTTRLFEANQRADRAEAKVAALLALCGRWGQAFTIADTVLMSEVVRDIRATIAAGGA